MPSGGRLGSVEISLSKAAAPVPPKASDNCGLVQTERVDKSVSSLQTKFLRDNLFHVETGRRASERSFSIVRHGFQRTLPIAEAFQAIRIRQ
jgi:hypothetical protein